MLRMPINFNTLGKAIEIILVHRMTDMIAIIQHHMNPLHIYCRLRDIEIPEGTACFLGRYYERSIFKMPQSANTDQNLLLVGKRFSVDTPVRINCWQQTLLNRSNLNFAALRSFIWMEQPKI